jgi:hypothetical protein
LMRARQSRWATCYVSPVQLLAASRFMSNRHYLTLRPVCHVHPRNRGILQWVVWHDNSAPGTTSGRPTHRQTLAV